MKEERNLAEMSHEELEKKVVALESELQKEKSSSDSLFRAYSEINSKYNKLISLISNIIDIAK